MATRKKKQTLAEFRAWLRGVEELQPEAWAPDATQWNLIREKINNISEPKASTNDAMIQKLLEGLNAAHAPVQYGNRFAPAPNLPLPPPAAGGVPAGPITNPTPEAAAVMPPQQKVDLVAAAKPPMESEGDYVSTFT